MAYLHQLGPGLFKVFYVDPSNKCGVTDHLANGIIDLVLAAIIFAGLPGTAAWALGLLVGINMLFGGTSLIAIAMHARSSDAAMPKSA